MAGVYAEICGFILAVKQCGFRAVRADEISKPGIITDQLIQHVINARMVVADLTGHNANGMGRRQKPSDLVITTPCWAGRQGQGESFYSASSALDSLSGGALA